MYSYTACRSDFYRSKHFPQLHREIKLLSGLRGIIKDLNDNHQEMLKTIENAQPRFCSRCEGIMNHGVYHDGEQFHIDCWIN